ncbi:MAG: peptide deformylase [Candidatus Peregrinibacteria bacterium]|nr:peptide deformylase [Candidatus Peregrinibacteria bacterium]
MFKIETGNKNPILRKTCKKVEVFDDKLKKTVNEMIETMTAPDPETDIVGIGLAANQCGLDSTILIITLNLNTRKEHKIVPMINPEVLDFSKNKVVLEEGCLSLPGTFAKISRPQKVKVRWQNLQGNICEKKLSNWDARIFQHEFDHLEGKLFTDYLEK